MFHNLHPKCANPNCAAMFEWLAGGKLLRFRRNTSPPAQTSANLKFPTPPYHVEHFWLCERCSHVYTLTCDPQQRVSIRPLWPVLPAAKTQLELPASKEPLHQK